MFAIPWGLDNEKDLQMIVPNAPTNVHCTNTVGMQEDRMKWFSETGSELKL